MLLHQQQTSRYTLARQYCACPAHIRTHAATGSAGGTYTGLRHSSTENFRPALALGCSRVKVSRCGISNTVAVVALHQRIHRGGGDAAAMRARYLDVALVAPVCAPRVLRARPQSPLHKCVRACYTHCLMLKQSATKTAQINAAHSAHDACPRRTTLLLRKRAGKTS